LFIYQSSNNHPVESETTNIHIVYAVVEDIALLEDDGEGVMGVGAEVERSSLFLLSTMEKSTAGFSLPIYPGQCQQSKTRL
jgi:hypothetical protein